MFERAHYFLSRGDYAAAFDLLLLRLVAYRDVDALRLYAMQNPVSLGSWWSRSKKKVARASRRAGKSITRTYASVDWKKVNHVAKVLGPAVATVFPVAAPAVAAGMVLSNMAKAGDVTAIAKIENLRIAAAGGSTVALEALNALKVAENVRKQRLSAQLLLNAQAGNPAAQAQLAAIQAAAAQSPQAMAAAVSLNYAKQSLTGQPVTQIIPYAALSAYDAAWA